MIAIADGDFGKADKEVVAPSIEQRIQNMINSSDVNNDGVISYAGANCFQVIVFIFSTIKLRKIIFCLACFFFQNFCGQ